MAKKRAKQKFLDGMEPPSIKEIDDAAEHYFETMTARCELSKTEDEQKDALIDVMKSNKMDRYETSDGIVVTITAKSNVNCKRKKDVSINGESDE